MLTSHILVFPLRPLLPLCKAYADSCSCKVGEPLRLSRELPSVREGVIVDSGPSLLELYGRPRLWCLGR